MNINIHTILDNIESSKSIKLNKCINEKKLKTIFRHFL